MAAALLNAYLLDWLFGDPRRGHPVAGFGRIASALERLLWRPSRAAGALYLATLVGCTALATAAVDRVLRRRPYTRLAWRSIVVWATLGGRSLERIALRLAGQVQAGDAVAGRSLASWRAAFTGGACRHPSPNAGRIEGAYAGALSVTLGGLNRYRYGTEVRPTIGSGPAPTPQDVARAVRLTRLVSIVAAAVCAALAWKLEEL